MPKQFNSDKIKQTIESKLKRKVTKRELAEVGKIPQSQLNYWDGNQQGITEFLIKISEYYGVKIDKLLED